MTDKIASKVAARVLAADIRMSQATYREALKAWDAGKKDEQAGKDKEHEQFNKDELRDALSEVQRAAKAVASGKKGDIQNLTANMWQLCYFAGALNG